MQPVRQTNSPLLTHFSDLLPSHTLIVLLLLPA